MRTFRRLRRSDEGVGAVEFALIAPLLITFIIGIAQLGTLFLANAGLRSAVAEGARLASIYPRPTDAAIIARINERRVGMRSQYVTGPTIVHTTDSSGNSYATITMRYSVPLNFIFFQTSPVTLTETRVVHTYSAATSTTTPSIPAPATTP